MPVFCPYSINVKTVASIRLKTVASIRPTLFLKIYIIPIDVYGLSKMNNLALAFIYTPA